MKGYFTLGVLLISPVIQILAQTPSSSQTPRGSLPQSSPDKSSWAARLSAVYTKMHLAADGTPPYRLHAHVRVFDFRHKFVAGELTYSYANWDRWRMETTWGNSTRVKIVSPAGRWRSPATADVVAEQHTEEHLAFAQFLKPDPRASFSSSRNRTIDGVSADCVTEKWRTSEPPFRPDTSIEREICLSSSNDFPVLVKSGTFEVRFGSGEYAVLGLRQFPRKFSFVEAGKKTMELILDSLESLNDISEKALALPEGAVSLPWCLNETNPFPIFFAGGSSGNSGYDRDLVRGRVNGPVISLGATVDFSIVIFDVDADGHVKSLEAFNRNGDDASQKSSAKALRDSKFKPATCGTGQPIENELVWISPSA
jgi:hypothetical protein